MPSSAQIKKNSKRFSYYVKTDPKQKNYILALPCLHARSEPLCAHSVHGPLDPQITKISKADPPYNVKTNSKPKKYLLDIPCLRARSNPLCAHSVHGLLAPLGAKRAEN